MARYFKFTSDPRQLIKLGCYKTEKQKNQQANQQQYDFKMSLLNAKKQELYALRQKKKQKTLFKNIE